MTVFTPLVGVLLLVAGWVGLRTLGARRWAVGLALAALAVQPLGLQQLTGPNTDLPAPAGLVWGAALCAAALGAKAPTTVIVLRQPAGYEPGARVPPGAGGPEPDPPRRALLLVPALVAFFLAIG